MSYFNNNDAHCMNMVDEEDDENDNNGQAGDTEANWL